MNFKQERKVRESLSRECWIKGRGKEKKECVKSIRVARKLNQWEEASEYWTKEGGVERESRWYGINEK